jgi:4-hydroxythreonine-4-phosphate dehydrogenase
VARIVITTGEPAGIGPEIALKAAAQQAHGAHHRLAFTGDWALLSAFAQSVAPNLRMQMCDAGHWAEDAVSVWHTPLTAATLPGTLNPANASYVLRTLDLALTALEQNRADAMVTCPVAKNVINDAGFAFTGHTEYLAGKTGTAQVVMMLAGGGLRVALATTHLALKDVPAALDLSHLVKTLAIIDQDLKTKFGIARPRIAVCGLNPHAGEGGYLGREEIEVITPAINAANAQGIGAHGPYPADTVFQPQVLDASDCVLAMYHDQGLPTLKYASFGQGVNVTLGLPVIRTSVDHGTALDIAGKGMADAGSLQAAIEMAIEMAQHRAPRA